MTTFSNKLETFNPVFGLFWAHFPNFWGKTFFSENQTLSRTTSHEILAPCQTLERINDTIPWKRPDRRKDGQTDGQKGKRMDKRKERLYFIGPFRLALGIQ